MKHDEKARVKDIGKLEHAKIHQWLRKNHGNAKYCSDEECEGRGKRFEWALKNGFKYEKNIENYMPLCSVCHRKYDGIAEMMSKRRAGILLSESQKTTISESHKGVPCPWNARVVSASKKGFYKEFNYIRNASEELSVSITSISNALNGRSKTAGGYQWKYV